VNFKQKLYFAKIVTLKLQPFWRYRSIPHHIERFDVIVGYGHVVWSRGALLLIKICRLRWALFFLNFFLWYH